MNNYGVVHTTESVRPLHEQSTFSKINLDPGANLGSIPHRSRVILDPGTDLGSTLRRSRLHLDPGTDLGSIPLYRSQCQFCLRITRKTQL